MRNASMLVAIVLLSALESHLAKAQWVQTAGPSGVAVYGLAVSDTNLFAGTSGGVFLSPDNGASWIPVNSGLPANTTVRCLAVYGGNLYAGTSSKGAFRSTNNGGSWTTINSGLPANPTVLAFVSLGTALFACSGGGVFKSTDSGGTWTQSNSGLTSSDVRSLVVSGANLFAAAYGGIFLSTNSGTDWTQVNSGLTNTDVWSLTSCASCVFAGTHAGGVFVTPDNGASWHPATAGLPANSIVQSLCSQGERIFAGTYLGGVFLSTNDGAQWVDINAGLTNRDARCLAVSGTHLFSGTYNGGVWQRPLAEIITAVNAEKPFPAKFTLAQNYPNPFNPLTTIKYALPRRAHVTLSVFTILGQQVAELVNADIDAGYHEVQFKASGLTSCVYFYRLQAGSHVETKKLLLLR